MLFRLILVAAFAAVAAAQCGCRPRTEPSLPQPDPETGLVEGDMELTTENYLQLLGLRNVASNTWPNRILYWTGGNTGAIERALNRLSSRTNGCVRFARRTNQANYVRVSNGGGCSSQVGMQRGAQRMSLNSRNCYSEHVIQHEFLHALGFYHEQSRSDRDRHVNIQWANIDSNECRNFYKGGSLPGGFPRYDQRSIMHYGANFFTCNNRPTIVARNGGRVGGNSLTSLDIAKIRALYRC